ncbi:hypothetical protein ACJMK2_017839 [Sinanodonta woodiana]|uniref:Carboxylesterase type B domain-containing protein n=1 Tax=Sinanodonta woodiana TaxID=1069815 RepID=A0ABD3UBK4_SINWO
MLHFKYSCIIIFYCIGHSIAPVIIRQLGDKVVETVSGKIRGVLVEFYEEYQLNAIDTFFGIPYASLKGLRRNILQFMPPSSPPKWKYLRDASKQNTSVVCLHRRLNEHDLMNTFPNLDVRRLLRQTGSLKKQDEDCLNLNLYVPDQGRASFILYFITYICFSVLQVATKYMSITCDPN